MFHVPVNQNLVVFFGFQFDRCTAALVCLFFFYLLVTFTLTARPSAPQMQPLHRRLEL